MKRPAEILIEVFENVLHRRVYTTFQTDIDKSHQFFFDDGLIPFLLFLFTCAVYPHGFFTSLVM